MKNIELNAGGLVGALVCAGIAAAIVLTKLDTTTQTPYRVIIIALIGGAFAGNFLWGMFIKKS